MAGGKDRSEERDGHLPYYDSVKEPKPESILAGLCPLGPLSPAMLPAAPPLAEPPSPPPLHTPCLSQMPSLQPPNPPPFLRLLPCDPSAFSFNTTRWEGFVTPSPRAGTGTQFGTAPVPSASSRPIWHLLRLMLRHCLKPAGS